MFTQSEDIFNKFFELLVDLEGGYSNHKNDMGGETNYGITKKTLEFYNQKENKNLSIKSLTKEQAKDIYYILFFTSIKPLENIPAYYHYFDICVHSGFNNYKICELETKGDIRRIVEWRRNFYARLVIRRPSQQEFLKGWYNRINKINNYFKVKI